MLWILAVLAAQDPAPSARYEEDFEDRQSLDVVYDRWERVRSPEHPAYNVLSVELDPAGAHAGRHFLRLLVHGGAAALRMTSAGAWRVDPSRPYRLSVHARMQGAVRNAATASLEWLDARRALLREDVSPPLAPVDAWTPIVLDVLRPPPGAQWARVKLQYGGGDVRGECRFDAVSLEAATRLVVSPAGRPSAIFEPQEAPRFEVTAYGLDPGEVRLSLRSRRPDGSEVQRVGPLAILPERPALVELRPHAPGFYEVSAEIAGPGGATLRGDSPLIVPAPWVFRPRGPRRIGMSINPFAREVPDAPAFARLAGGDRLRVTFSDAVPRGHTPPDDERLAKLVRLLAQPDHARLVGVLARPTAPLRDVFSPRRRDAWEGPLRALAGRHAGLVEAWEIGDGPGAFRLRAERLDSLEQEPSPAVRLPGPAGDDAASTAAFARALMEHAAGGTGEPFVELAPPLVDAQGRPRAGLLLLRVLNDLLSDAAPWPEAPSFLDTRQAAFEKEGRTILAFWSPEEVERDAQLGDRTTLHPLLGAPRPHRPGERLRIGPLPILAVQHDDAAPPPPPKR